MSYKKRFQRGPTGLHHFEPVNKTAVARTSNSFSTSGADARTPLGILLTYYPQYAESALTRFSRLMTRLDPRAHIVVVHNGTLPPPVCGLHVHVIPGDNSLREFSGWDAGLAFARNNGLLPSDGIVVFANDTFCHHNKFGPITRFAFTETFRRLMADPELLILAGEKFELGGLAIVDDLPIDAWISTYLFAMTPRLVRQLHQLSPANSMQRFYAQSDGELVFSDRLSPNLARYIRSWLLGLGGTRWKNIANVDMATLENLQGKANSIICENSLSARVIAMQGMLLDAFISPRVRALRRLDSLGSRIRSHVFGGKFS